MECQPKPPPLDTKVFGKLINKAHQDKVTTVQVVSKREDRSNPNAGPVVLKREDRSNPNADPNTLWFKDYTWVNTLKDDERNNLMDERGNLPYSLVNAAGKAMKHAPTANTPVIAVPYIKPNPRNPDMTLLWIDTEGGDGFTFIHEFENRNLVLDVINQEILPKKVVNQDEVPVPVVVSNYDGGDTQCWKMQLKA